MTGATTLTGALPTYHRVGVLARGLQLTPRARRRTVRLVLE